MDIQFHYTVSDLGSVVGGFESNDNDVENEILDEQPSILDEQNDANIIT